MLSRLLHLWKTSNHAAWQAKTASASDGNSDAATRASAERVIEQALEEMNGTIARLQAAKSASEQDSKEIAQTLADHAARAERITTEMKRCLAEKTAAAQAQLRELATDKSAADGLLVSYQAIAHNISTTLRQLDAQISRMLVQRDDIKAKRLILAAQLASAASEQEFLTNTRALGASQSALEHEVDAAQARRDLASEQNLDETQAFVELSEASIVEALEAEVQRERDAKRALEDDLAHKRFRTAFSVSAQNPVPLHTGNTNASKQMTTDNLAQFFSAADAVLENSAGKQSQETTPIIPQKTSPEQPLGKPIDAIQTQMKNFFERP
jgi:hypothetical protein